MLKRYERREGCKFCQDEEFAVRHVMEDDALIEVAAAAVQVVLERKLSGARLISPDTWMRLERALNEFRNLDNEEKELKRVVSSLKRVEQELSD